MIVPKTLRRVRNLLKPVSVHEFYSRRNKILVVRAAGGMGDILMHRMIFEDMKKLDNDLKIHFAIPLNYFDAASRHPYIDKVLNCRDLDENEYTISYHTTTQCVRYEQSKAPYVDKHRSDIWANHCGVELANHNMHLNLEQVEIDKAKKLVAPFRENGKPLICLCPISAMVNKDLDKSQATRFLNLVSSKYNVFTLHYERIDWLKCPTISHVSFWDWLAVINASDYIVTVDTGSFHASNGLAKPTVGIFSWADGLVYGKYHPKLELVQKHRDYTVGWTCGPCHNWPSCPLVPTDTSRKPCITTINGDDIANALDRLATRHPI